jgi:hypothetical protein
VAGRLSDINDQQREVQELLFPAAKYAAQVKVTDEMVKAFYDKNAALFQVPEQIKAEYVVLNADAVDKLVTVSDAEIARRLQQEQGPLLHPGKAQRQPHPDHRRQGRQAGRRRRRQGQGASHPGRGAEEPGRLSRRSPRRSRRIRARPNWAATWAWSRRACSTSRSKMRSSS